MTQGFTIQGDGFIQVQAKLNDLRSRIRSSATLNVGWDDRTNYPDGTPVAKIARVQEYGAVINHPGGTRYITDAVISRKGKLLMTTRFVGAGFKGDTFTTAAHEIVVPARPFIRPAIIEHGDEWAQFVFHDIEETDAPLDVILERLGIRIVGDIQNAIRSVQSPRLAAETIRRRLKRGFSDYGSATKPLIDTGTMLRTIRSEVTEI